MKFNSSNSIEHDKWQVEDHYLLFDEERKEIRLQQYLVRYGPGDDYTTVMDQAISLSEFEQREDLRHMVTAWFGETTLRQVLEKILELR